MEKLEKNIKNIEKPKFKPQYNFTPSRSESGAALSLDEAKEESYSNFIDNIENAIYDNEEEKQGIINYKNYLDEKYGKEVIKDVLFDIISAGDVVPAQLVFYHPEYTYDIFYEIDKAISRYINQ